MDRKGKMHLVTAIIFLLAGSINLYNYFSGENSTTSVISGILFLISATVFFLLSRGILK